VTTKLIGVTKRGKLLRTDQRNHDNG